MSTKTKNRARHPELQALDETASDDVIEHFLRDHHATIADKLASARASIASGQVKPLEKLSVLLREARRRAKPAK
jgi:hypothetical protein